MLESDWRPGGAMYWKTADGTIDLEGRVIEIEPEKMIRYSFTMPQDIVALMLDEQNNYTVLSVTHEDFANKPDGEECYLGSLAGWDIFGEHQKAGGTFAKRELNNRLERAAVMRLAFFIEPSA